MREVAFVCALVSIKAQVILTFFQQRDRAWRNYIFTIQQ